MGRRSWESGTIKIPASEWPKFKAVVREAAQKEQMQALPRYESAVQYLKATLKGRLNISQTDMQNAFYASDKHNQANLLLLMATFDPQHPELFSTPTRAQIRGYLGVPITVRTNVISVSDNGALAFIEKEKSARWYVDEGKNAREEARESPIGKAFFKGLAQIKFGKHKHSGGVICGNDENNEDSREVGGGANYITGAYGPAGELEQKQHRGF